jgi:hypothetical protein
MDLGFGFDDDNFIWLIVIGIVIFFFFSQKNHEKEECKEECKEELREAPEESRKSRHELFGRSSRRALD